MLKFLALVGGKVERQRPNVSFLEEYEYTDSDAEDTTSSSAWVTKSGFPWTTAAKTAGQFTVHYVGAVARSNGNAVGFRVGYRINGAGAYTYMTEEETQPNGNNVYVNVASFKRITVPLDGDTIEFIVEFSGVAGGGTRRCREVRLDVRKTS